MVQYSKLNSRRVLDTPVQNMFCLSCILNGSAKEQLFRHVHKWTMTTLM